MLEVFDVEGCVFIFLVDFSLFDSLLISSDLKEDDGWGYWWFVVEVNGGLEFY